VSRRLALLTGLYVAVVCSAQIGALKITRLPFTHLDAPGGVYAIGVSLALVQGAHYSAGSRIEGWRNAQLLIASGFAASGFLAGYIALVVHLHPAFPGQGYDRVLGSTWRIVAASLAAFLASETVDNALGAPLRGRVPDPVRVALTNGVAVPLDSVVFLTAAFGSDGLDFFDGQVVGKLASALLVGVPLVLLVRRLLRQGV
jgi:uncharacterized PurR-regulated membrane protein YhhQ (DUF165 family)